MSPAALTDRQREILNCIRRHCDNGMPPSVREIGADTGIGSTNGVMCHLKALHAKGLIHLGGGKARGIRPVLVDGWEVDRQGDRIVVRTDGPLTLEQAQRLGQELLRRSE